MAAARSAPSNRPAGPAASSAVGVPDPVDTSQAGRTAVVTSASSGIGRAAAETLGRACARGVLGGWTAERMRTSVATIAVGGGTAEAHVVDVRVGEGVQALVEQAMCSTGRLDIMVNVVTVMPGAVATDLARHFDPAVLQSLAALDDVEVDVAPGGCLPDEVLDPARRARPDHLAAPEDVAEAVLGAVSRPPTFHVSELVVRPNRDLAV
jgi:NADP-dependent 3-hydroxy acid dehydrogenase YdfG